jgi:hypothetical protein
MLHPIRGAGLMVEKLPPTTFVMTRLIGGKLRALYDEEEQPCSSRMAELLETLDAQGLPETGTREREERVFPHVDRDSSGQARA